MREKDSKQEKSTSIFRTGSGKSVGVKQSSLSKASSILGDIIDDQGCLMIMENGGGHFESPSMFQTGLGNSVVVKQSSLSKALSVLDDKGDFSGRNSDCSFATSTFQTGSGKAVNISTSGLVKANKLLGLEENHDRETFQGFEKSMKQSNASQHFGLRGSPHLSTKVGMAYEELKDNNQSLITPLKAKSVSKPPPMKFHTAGGKSISVSSDALQRARSLLGDLELGSFLNEGDADGGPVFSIFKDRKSAQNSNKENKETIKSKHTSKNFISPLRSTSSQNLSLVRSKIIGSGKNLMNNFDAVVHDSTSGPNNDIPCQRKPPSNKGPTPNTVQEDRLANGTVLRTKALTEAPGWPLVDITNNMSMDDQNSKQNIGEKRRLGRTSSVSPFKRPRGSKFITPLTNHIPFVPKGSSTLAPEESCQKKSVSSRYPFQTSRKYVKEYFVAPPSHKNMLEHLPEWIKKINPETAEQHCFHDGCGLAKFGKEAFSHMLMQSGASMQYVSEKWVANHYKWIVWKLACYERCYSGKLLTVSNVFEELKYRYEREVNHGHRSAIKRILEGDASPSSALVLCISSVRSNCESTVETSPQSHGVDSTTTATTIELSDGWYSVNALLDVQLSKKLAAGKLFLGQKLRISGAGLCGWTGPVSPLEASGTASLALHINGSYRAHWADRLGFCKSGSAPLAFRCIKSNGGAVPSTFVGIQRIYPVLYRERLSNGGYTVRSERMEAKMLQLYNQRRSNVTEGIMSEFQRGKDFQTCNDDSEDGAKIFRKLETTAEPEVLMAEMSTDQLNSFAIYRAKLEATRQSDMHTSIEKALANAGLSEREVTPFVRVRVVGLTSKSNPQKHSSHKGLVTIWNPTEKQNSELVEGQAYVFTGLLPLSSDSDTLFLQARGSTTKWQPLSPSTIENFQPFFSPRKPVSLSDLGEVSLTSEFDIAGLVVFVGEVYTDAHQKKQWAFVTDGSTHESNSKEQFNSLLAISFCLPNTDCDSFVPVNSNLVGSMVGLCNLVKRAKDHINNIWVAEATENSTYSLTYDHPYFTHLKEAAASAEKWAKISSLTIEKFKAKVLSIVGNCEGKNVRGTYLDKPTLA